MLLSMSEQAAGELSEGHCEGKLSEPSCSKENLYYCILCK